MSKHALMSAATSDSDPSEWEAAPELTPLVAEVLRTRYCAPGSVAIVEGVDITYMTPNKARRRGSQSQSQPRRRRERAIPFQHNIHLALDSLRLDELTVKAIHSHSLVLNVVHGIRILQMARHIHSRICVNHTRDLAILSLKRVRSLNPSLHESSQMV